jgi:hypothetical protein
LVVSYHSIYGKLFGIIFGRNKVNKYQNLYQERRNMEDSSLSPHIQKVEVLLTFPEAIVELIKGRKITRDEWNDVNEYGVLADGLLTIHTKGVFNKWLVNDGDLLATDWKLC